MRFTSAINLVNRLEPAHLQCFWYFPSKVNLAIIGTFGSLLWATSDNAEAEFYRSQLADYRWKLRVSSNGAEFMKFTVGMLDASAVFAKKGSSSKTGTPVVIHNQETQTGAKIEQSAQQYAEGNIDMMVNPTFVANEASPSIGTSTENTYSYEAEYAGPTTLASDIRPPWSEFMDTGHSTAGDGQSWSSDQLYNFENIQGIEDILGNRRTVQEYDESGNFFAGF